MKARPKSAKSQFQINFQTKQTFQRNKQFLTKSRAVSLQREYSVLRRKPIQTQDNHISQKINSSFMNTTAQLTQRTHRNLLKKKSVQLNLPVTMQTNQTIQQISPTKQKRAKSFSIEKMTSREYHHKLRNKVVPDQRRFNNFQPFQCETKLYCSFDKMRTNAEQKQKSTLNIEYDTRKLYEEYYYKRTTNNCTVDYKSQKKLKSQRYFFTQKNPENLAATQLDPQKVDKGLKIATNYKNGNISKSNIEQFYCNSGRDLPSQTQMRFMNELTNHWKDQLGNIKKKKLDYQTKKMKEDMQNQRMRKIKYSKQARNERSEMCDQKYFRRFHF